jgi:hypothetical protein
MIISGLQTGNTRWLARHLQNSVDNEDIELAEITGTVATDIDGALVEMDALCAGTRAKEGVYAVFINPPKPLTREQFMRAIALIEERLGLTGQPRIILFHIKNGRHHCHAVWSRIDLEQMKAIHLSHDRQKLRKCAQALGAEFGFDLPPGLKEDRGAERFEDPERKTRPTRAEKAQAKTSGITPEERRAAITASWHAADSAESFINSLEEQGYLLAKGDSRAFVVVDIACDVHSLARQIDGAKTKDVNRKLSGVDLTRLPSVEKAKLLMLQRAAALQDAVREKAKKDVAADAHRAALYAAQRHRKLQLDLRWQQMKIRHMHERKVLLGYFMAENRRHLARRQWQAIGLALYLRKLAVLREIIRYYKNSQRKQELRMETFHREVKAALQLRHQHEAADLQRRYDALRRLDRHEARAFDQIQHARLLSQYTHTGPLWTARNDWDVSGSMNQALSAIVEQRRTGHKPRSKHEDLRYARDYRQRSIENGLSERLQRTLGYMQENGIEICEQYGHISKWLPLQRQYGSRSPDEVLAEFKANSQDVTGRFQSTLRARTSSHHGPKPSRPPSRPS